MAEKCYREAQKPNTTVVLLIPARTDRSSFHEYILGKAEIPAADVVEVVRCENCIRRGTEDCAMYYGCECGEQHTWETDNDFCSWGERKMDKEVTDETERTN